MKASNATKMAISERCIFAFNDCTLRRRIHVGAVEQSDCITHLITAVSL